MESQRLEQILEGFARVRVLVLGDYFLDEYLTIDPGLAEISIETGLEARQVVAVRKSPGAAGTVCSNLASLGVRTEALGIVGDDGHGYELIRGLRCGGIGVGWMIQAPDRATPTYTKPMKRNTDGTEEEMERIDIKNRIPTPSALEDLVIDHLRSAVGAVDGVIVGDQVEEEECGVVTGRIRAELADLAALNPSKVFLADSRCRIGRFRGLIIKPNQNEAVGAVWPETCDQDELLRRLFADAGKPVFLTCGERGIFVYDGTSAVHCPAVPVPGPIDIVGAGDSSSAGIVASLCAGSTLRESAEIGNLVASVTIRKIGTTGTASREEVLHAAKGC